MTQSTGRIIGIAKLCVLAQPNNSFKPSPLRGLVFAVTFTATLGRYAGRLNSGVRPVLKGQGLQLKSKQQSNKRTAKS